MTDPLSLTVLKPYIAKIASSSVGLLKSPAEKLKDDLSNLFRKGFEEYLSIQAQRYSRTKTILGSSMPLALSDIYVNLHLSNEDIFVKDDDLMRISNEKLRFMFVATAGSGKSMLMRYIFFQFVKEQSRRLPLFVELRDLNERADQTLTSFIVERLSETIDGFTESRLRNLIRQGGLALFLDGYDEIDFDVRSKRGREINALAGNFSDLLIFVSSRPEEGLKGWDLFNIYKVGNLSEAQVRLLIKKIPYDPTTKDIFIKKLDEGLYKTHSAFLFNPLLTVMMLITLEHFAEVPAKIHLFYEFAFEALFARHDVSKGGFKRKRRVNIALDDYRRLFSYFCAMTYLKQQFVFSEDTALFSLAQSIKASQIDAKKDDMLDDLVSCTCMLVRDGLEYTFSHRSFQEYFMAYFLARVKTDEFKDMAPRLVNRGAVDNVFLMMSEMNQEKFEEAWALPQVENYLQPLQSINPHENPVGFLKLCFGATEAEISVDHFTCITMPTPRIQTRNVLFQVYGIFEMLHPNLDGTDSDILGDLYLSKVLPDDKRFSKFRCLERSNAMFKFRLTQADNVWVRRTRLGQFVGKELPAATELRNRLRQRVAERRDGLSKIFDFGSAES